ncbi:MAG: sugar phosphate isomerase/epimerase [Clostridia bacterium]|nr:sugar phosphate isomerase/epimerase [Clostridia bacterium]
MNKNMIGLSSCGKPLNEERFKSYGENGISCIEISCDKNATDKLNYKELDDLSKKYGVRLWSLHLPFCPFEIIDISNPLLADSTVDYYIGIIRKAAAVGIDKFIVHPSGEPIEPEDRKSRMDCAKEHLARLADLALSENATICVEDLPRTCLGNCSQEINELVSAHSALRVVFDTNHLLNEDISLFIQNVGSKIVSTHISDYDFVNERHWLCGEGDIDWKKLYSALSNVGYSGAWLYELGFGAPATLCRERDLTCEDFARNAAEIFENREITVIGKRKPNLGMWG